MRERLEHVIDPLTAHLLDPFERRLAGEMADPAKQRRGLRVEQPVGPLHRRPQAALALRQVACAGPERVRRLTQPLEQLVGREQREPRRRKLDPQRGPLELAAQRRHRPRIGAVGRELARGLLGPREQQIRRRPLSKPLERVGVLLDQAERHLAGDEDPQPRRGGE